MHDIFSPFSMKYLLRSRFVRPANPFPGRLNLTAPLDWHWDIRHDDAYADMMRDYAELLAEPFSLYDMDTPSVVEDQLTWDMRIHLRGEDELRAEDARQYGRPDRPEQTVDRIPQEDPAMPEMHPDIMASTASPDPAWRMERMAFYAPAHTHTNKRYGIHLSRRGMVHVTRQVHQFCPDQPLEVILLAASYLLFAHEMCHAWIEDLVSLYDFSSGEQRGKQDRRYTRTNARHHNHIFMEEALCNTAAYGWLQWFLLDQSSMLDRAWPSCDRDIVLGAFEHWLRGQPRGYRDFLAIRQRPHQSNVFLRNLFRLLCSIYQCCDDAYCYRCREFCRYEEDPYCHFHNHDLLAVMESFFGVDIRHGLMDPGGRRYDVLWHSVMHPNCGSLPLHLDP
jgi:hypothetical protein